MLLNTVVTVLIFPTSLPTRLPSNIIFPTSPPTRLPPNRKSVPKFRCISQPWTWQLCLLDTWWVLNLPRAVRRIHLSFFLLLETVPLAVLTCWNFLVHFTIFLTSLIIDDNRSREGDICVFDPSKSEGRVTLIFQSLEISGKKAPGIYIYEI